MKHLKRGIDRTKAKLRRLIDSPTRTTSATQSATASNSELGQANITSAQPLPAVAPPHSIQPESLDNTSHTTPTPIVSAALNQDTRTVSQHPDPSVEEASSTRVPASNVPSDREENQTNQPDPTVVLSKPSDTQSAKHTAWAGLKTLLNVLNDSTDAFAPLKSAFSGLWSCIETFEVGVKNTIESPVDNDMGNCDQNEAVARKEYDDLRTELNNLCQDISGYINAHVPPSITPSIEALAQGIKKETEEVNQKVNRNAPVRYVEVAEDVDDVLDCYRRIQSLLNRLALNANMNVWRIVDEEATRNRLKELPYSSAAKYSSTESDSLGRNGCTPDTRVEVLDNLRDRTKDSQSHRIFWLNGMAGTGKTTIAYTLCELLHESGELAASFFCSRQLPLCRNVGRILPSIAYQLSLFSHPFRYKIDGIIKRDPEVHNQPVARQFESLIAKPLREIGHTLPVDLVIVIDALDECDDADGVGRMLSAMLACAKGLPVKVFVTSRPEPQILDRMESEQGERIRSVLRLHELERSTVQSDIKSYLTTELKELNVAPNDLETLAQRSGVLFIYASTVVRYVTYDGSARGSPRLKQILATPILVDTSHQGIDSLYTTILESALGNQRLSDSEREEMVLVLRSVICTLDPLSIDDIACLLGLDRVEPVNIALRPLLSVLQVSNITGLVTTLHESFPDYMLDEKRSKRFYCDSKRHHAWFTQACLNRIKIPNPPFNICNLESSYVSDEEVPGLGDRLGAAIPQHLFYACRYWEPHLELAEPSEELLSEVFQLLSTRLLLWMEVMNLKRSIEHAVTALSRLNMWLHRVENSNELRELVQDAWRFAAAYASSPIQQFTPHLYVSALPLWPQDRPVSRHYSRLIKCLVVAFGTALVRPDAALLAVWPAPPEALCIAYSPDGAYIASGSVNGFIHIRDARSGQMLRWSSRNHAGAVQSIAYSPDGARIVSGSYDKTVRIWDAYTGDMLGQPFEEHMSVVMSVAYSPDGERIISGSWDKTVRIWDAYTGQMVGQPLEGHTGPIFSVAYSSNGHITSGGEDGTLRNWDVQTGEVPGEPMRGNHTSEVYCVAYSPDGAYLISGCNDGTIRIWNAHTRQIVGEPIDAHTSAVWSVAYSSDGARFISCSWDGTIRTWDAHTGHMLGQLSASELDLKHDASVYSPDGKRIASGSPGSHTICIWDAYTKEAQEGHTSAINSIACSPHGVYIVSGCSDKTVRIWDTYTGKMLGQPLEGHTGSICVVACSPDGTSIASGSDDTTTRIWDVQSGQMAGQPLQSHTSSVVSVAYSPDGTRVVSASADHTIRVWDVRTGQMLGCPLHGHTDSVVSVAYSPDGRCIVSGSKDHTIRVWNTYTGQTLGPPLEGHAGTVNQVAYSPNGAHILSCSSDKTIRVWDAHTKKALGRPLEDHTDNVLSAAYSPDGAYIVSGSADMTVRIWDARTGRLLGPPLEGHTDSVNAVSFSLDGASVVSCSSDKTIRIWDAHVCCAIARSAQDHTEFEGRVGHSSKDAGPVTSVLGNPTQVDSSTIVELASSSNRSVLQLPRPWTLREDGWVVGRNLERLVWVPPELRNSLLRFGNRLMISVDGSWELDISKAKFGTEWTQCYQPSDSSL
ncbi:hypothetical protein FRC12_018420 [Ceratobasidium sp. 428]|nr:hypothetical protein FRC12_018420 [Ceratobasidium sp. 428]